MILSIRRAAAFLLCSAMIWVSPGLEAYAAEGRIIELKLANPVNAAGASVKPSGRNLQGLDLPRGIGTVGLSAGQDRITTVGLETAAVGLDKSAGVQGPGASLGLTRAALDLRLPLDASRPGLAPNAGAVVPGAELAGEVPAAAAIALSGTELGGKGLAITGAAERVANVGRIDRGILALKALFGDKEKQSLTEPSASVATDGSAEKSPEAKLEASPAQGPPAAKQDGGQPPAPPAKPSDDGGKNKPNSPWKNAYVFIAGLIVAQVGVEAWSAAWAKWAMTNFNTPKFDAYTTITMVAMVTSLVAGFVGGWATDKLGLKRTFIGTLAAVAAISAATLILFQMHILTVATPALLIGLVIAKSFFNSANGTAQQTVPIAIFKDDKAAFQKYNSSSQFILEIAGILVPFGIGALLGVFGFVGTMWIMPVTLAAAVAILAIFLKIQDVKKEKDAAPAKEKPTDPGLLKIAMWGYPALVLLNYLLYAVISIGYGNFLHPGASALEQAAASGVAGKIVSLYSAGGLIAAGILSGVPQSIWTWLKKKLPWLDKKAAALAAKLPARLKPAAVDENDPHADAKSAAKWLIFSAIGMASFIPLLFTSPWLAAAAMIPFGLTNVMSTLQLISIAQSNTPQDKKGKVMGMIRTVSTALATAGIFGFSKLVEHYPGSRFPFVVFLALGGVLAAYYVFTSIRLRRHVKSHDTANDAK